MLQAGLITLRWTDWTCNVVLVRKKDASTRFCLDFCQLNNLIPSDNYPIPRVSDVMNYLSGGKVFSKLDAKSGYWSIPMCSSDGSDKNTGFITRYGTYYFTWLPFGIKTAPNCFQETMDNLFHDLRYRDEKMGSCSPNLDDLTITGASKQIHDEILPKVLLRLRNAGIKLHPKKSQFGYEEIKLLGFVVNSKGISPDPEKVEAIVKMRRPRTVKQLRSFLGTCNACTYVFYLGFKTPFNYFGMKAYIR